ncbi:MAG TPA: HlyD family efflux transporter periplasmic adaptor subunit [Thermoanaerobaculia bacterium]|nr:HlyD family efflux transporter periplasmic adaptor subunit [Thermoanaerobaculia bacterium]
MRKRWRWVVGLAVVIVVVALVAFPRRVEVEVAEVVVGPLEVTLDEEGETRVREPFLVSAPIAGRVERIELEPGDPVIAEDTVIATFRPSAPVLLDARSREEARASVEAAEAAVGGARAERERIASELAYARAEAARYERLAGEGIVSEDLLDQVRLRVSTQEEALQAAEYALRTAEGDLRMARARLLEAAPTREEGGVIAIRSPVDGVVLRRLQQSEAVVPAGTPLVEVGDTSDLEVVADYLSSDAVRMKPGYAALIERWGGEPLLARVRRIEPSGFTKISALGVEEQRVNVILDLDGEQREAWEQLGDGFRVEVRVVIWADDRVRVVPTGALFREGERWAVYRVEDGRARLRLMEIGVRSPQQAQVLDGLAPGDLVVLHPGEMVSDGVRVRF